MWYGCTGTCVPWDTAAAYQWHVALARSARCHHGGNAWSLLVPSNLSESLQYCLCGVISLFIMQEQVLQDLLAARRATRGTARGSAGTHPTVLPPPWRLRRTVHGRQGHGGRAPHRTAPTPFSSALFLSAIYPCASRPACFNTAPPDHPPRPLLPHPVPPPPSSPHVPELLCRYQYLHVSPTHFRGAST